MRLWRGWGQGADGKCEDGSGGGECRQTQAFHSDPREA